MACSSYVDRYNDDHCSQPRGFLTPPPTWRTNRRSPLMPRSEMKPKPIPQQLRGDAFHIIHKIPSGDSPYVRAKHVQLVDKDPSRAISLFWAAINAGDRVDSALKDMAVVMKQLNRSDEAIEAIKSFRHLSPPESQESLDNILVELFKQSGRIEEEIELLHHKLKLVEEGMAFSGKKTKMARSQGKKVLITVQKEYSRLLGNLAWAYMQHGAFKLAEENYRKALSFEVDKNKQCNLAVCLMHMNKMTEAKFLLETVPSANGAVDESYAKSYERALEILAEFESQGVIRPVKQMEQKSFGGQRGCRFSSQKHSDDGNAATQLSPLPSSVKMNNGTFTDFAYEKRADFDWRTNHLSGRRGSDVPLTQPRRSSRSGDQRNPDLTENANGSYCRKLSFESSTSSDSFANQSVGCIAYSAPDEMPKIFPHFLEKFNGGDKKRSPSVKTPEEYDEGMKDALPAESNFSADSGNVEDSSRKNPCEHKKSWADMVEEDEQEFGSWKTDYYSKKPSFSVAAMDEEEGSNDENLDTNIIPSTPKLNVLAEKISEETGLIDLGGGYLTQPDKAEQSKNHQPLRRSLCFDPNLIPDLEKLRCSSPLTTKVQDFEGQAGNHKNRRRLQVFQDITHLHGSPRP